MQVWKFPIDKPGVHKVEMPEGARVVHVAAQDGKVCLWAVVDPENIAETKQFQVVGTGWDVEWDDETYTGYIGTARTGIYVWHVFERYEA